MRFASFLISVIAGASVLGATARAADDGLVGLHQLRNEGGRVCMSDHDHSGSSSGQGTRQAAEQSAIANWQDFTAWEYGNEWGRYSLAANKSVSCTGNNGSVACTVIARPCRPGAVGGGVRSAALRHR